MAEIALPKSVVSPELKRKVSELGRLWAESQNRPRVSNDVKRHWDNVVEEWISDPAMPLAARKTSNDARGGVVVHKATERVIVPCDNSPAQWAFACALRGHKYSLVELREKVSAHQVPFTFATKRAEKDVVKYRGTLASCGIDLNARGWKLCHIDPVGFRGRVPICDLSLSQLTDHFRRLLRPSNHFVVPKEWSGLGELPEVILEIRKYEESY